MNDGRFKKGEPGFWTGKKRKPFSLQARINMGKAHKGLKMSEETKKKLSLAKKGKSYRKGYKHSEETKRKIGDANKISQKGKKLSEETRKKIGDSHRGAKAPWWKGGYQNKLMLNRNRRIIKIGNGGSHTLGDWENLKAQYDWTCPHCYKVEPKIVLTEDHIIPVSKGGSNNIENIQPLCKSCNSRKSNKI